ncbi:MAG: hypothetical protein QM638_04720, partial [Nocardioides sp.]|uniref:hypothetical protein n=1 Tax=Nocardioides sp. TaxID=35761 RepID=UPI0039E2FF0E
MRRLGVPRTTPTTPAAWVALVALTLAVPVLAGCGEGRGAPPAASAASAISVGSVGSAGSAAPTRAAVSAAVA